MGRVIGDGGTAFQIVHLCVHPARHLYEKFGFADTATHDSIGMYRLMRAS